MANCSTIGRYTGAEGRWNFRLAVNPEVSTLEPMGEKEGRFCESPIFDLRAACVHLIFAAYATDRGLSLGRAPLVLNDQAH